MTSILSPAGLGTRPSSWPVRKERRHFAAAAQVNRFDNEIMNVEEPVHEQSTKICDMALDMLVSLMTGDEIAARPFVMDLLVQKVERLELLTVCSPGGDPTVEYVLCAALEMKRRRLNKSNCLSCQRFLMVAWAS